MEWWGSSIPLIGGKSRVQPVLPLPVCCTWCAGGLLTNGAGRGAVGAWHFLLKDNQGRRRRP